MPARDIYHNTVTHALEKAGWQITHDPFRLQWGTKDMYVDLGAEELVAAEQQGQKIAVEIKSFVQQQHLRLIVFSPDQEEVVQWIP
ncbi:element excision factor XisH family protein [Candidatus Oscillochloris fontis]|uniref:element excision factor XisH family protein n=1 Tax=Candidatus Oscillochloris fontis TaxID=2496868 RepID=UPI00101D1A37|nr:element excision factor XisH family protein [Candidatus Oscillochloris fontis]